MVANAADRLDRGPAAGSLRLGQQGHGAVHADVEHTLVGRDGFVFRPVLHVGAEAADAGQDDFAILGMRPQFARQREQRQRLLQGHVGRRHVAQQRLALGLLLALRFAELDVEAVGALAQRDLLAGDRIDSQDLGAVKTLAACRVGVGIDDAELPREAAFRRVGAADEGAELAELEPQAAVRAGRAIARVLAAIVVGREEVGAEFLVELVEHFLDPQVLGLADGGGKCLPEFAQHLVPVDLAAGNIVELVLEMGGEAVFDVAGEIGLQERRDDTAAILGNEALAVDAHVIAALQHLDDAGVGRGTADAELLELLDQAGFRIARRRLGEMLLRHDLAPVHRLVLGDVGQDGAGLVVVALVVLAFVVEREEAVELHDRAGGAKLDGLVAAGDVDRHLVQHGAFHLAGDGALPDQLVEAELVLVQIGGDVLRRPEQVGRTHGFVRFLGVLGLGRVDTGARRDVVGAVLGLDQAAGLADRLGRELHAIGTHVGDEADRLAADVDAFVQALGDAHGGGGAEAQLARCFLLQGRGDEGRRRVAPDLAAVDGGDGEGATLDLVLGLFGALLGVEVELLELAAVEMGEAGLQHLLLGRAEIGIDRPVFAGLEDFDLRFALADQAQRHRLDAAGRTAARQLAPQHGREREADQIVERAARQIGVDQRLVEVARIGHRVEHRLLGDGVEGDTLHVDAGQHLLVLQDVENMPGNGFAFAIRVGGEVKLAALADGLGDRVDSLLRLGVDFPVHGEVLVGPHRAILGRKVADMTVRGQHGVAGAEILPNGLCLGRGLDDQHVHRRICSSKTLNTGAKPLI